MASRLLWFALGLLSLPDTSAQAPSLVSYVNPLSGTAKSCQGNVYPAVGVPNGLTHWTPDTTGNQVKCLSPYYYESTTLVGFRGSHFLSGSCMQDFGSFTVMPMTGSLRVVPDDRATPFSHDQEASMPHLYQVQLPKESLNVSLTGTTRAGMLQVTSTSTDPVTLYILIQANFPDGGANDTSFSVVNQTIAGSSRVRRLYMQTGALAGFSGHVFSRFSRKPDAIQTVTVGQVFCAYATFSNVQFGDSVTVSLGTSFTSQVAARANLDTEIGTGSFIDIAKESEDVWEAALGRIQVTGGEQDHIEVFYSALYHSLLHPRIFSDADGSYPPFAAVGGTQRVSDHQYYDDFSMWDIFRAQMPLLSIVYPEKLHDMVYSLHDKASIAGWLPIFPAWNSYTQEMIGDHASVVIADAFAKGIVSTDFMKDAYKYMRQNAFDTPSSDDYLDGKGRRALGNYTKYGYVPLDDPVLDAFHKGEQVSRTIEYSYDDYVLSIVAAALNIPEDQQALLARSSSWKRVYNDQDFVCARFANGSFSLDCDPTKKYRWLTEESGWVWSFCVPHDIPGLAELMGGVDALDTKLDALFDNGWYDHGNEPSHHTAYTYAHIGLPRKTQEKVAYICRANYSTGPEGLSGNDDAGQMSAWLVLSAIGFYQVIPGVPQYTIGTPMFDYVEIQVDGQHKNKNAKDATVFRVVAEGRSEQAIYILRAELNGNALDSLFVSHEDLMKGGELRLFMTADKNA